jgi:hypothetical protein
MAACFRWRPCWRSSGFQHRIELHLTLKRQTRAMPVFRFIPACSVGFFRLHHLRFLKREPMLTGILHVAELPPQCIFWRLLAWLHRGIARPLLVVEKRMRAVANVQLETLTIDTGTAIQQTGRTRAVRLCIIQVKRCQCRISMIMPPCLVTDE